MYYSTSYTITVTVKKDQQIIQHIVHDNIVIDESHPLISHYGLKVGVYSLKSFIPKELRRMHDAKINNTIKEIISCDAQSIMLAGKSLMSDINKHRIITLSQSDEKGQLIFTKSTEPKVYIRVQYLKTDLLKDEQDNSQYIIHFSIQLIPLDLYESFLKHLDECTVRAINLTNTMLSDNNGVNIAAPEEVDESTNTTFIKIGVTNIERHFHFIRELFSFQEISQLQDSPRKISEVIEEMLLLVKNEKIRILFEKPNNIDWLINEHKLASMIFLSAVYNMLHNAFKYAKSEVHIAIKQQDTYITVSVYDDGEQCLVDPFSTERENMSPISKGWNGNWSIGLSFTRNLLKKYGGIIDLNQEKMHGKTFYTSIPSKKLTISSNKIEEVTYRKSAIDFFRTAKSSYGKRLAEDDVELTLLTYQLHSIKNMMAFFSNKHIKDQKRIVNIIEQLKNTLSHIFNHDIFEKKKRTVVNETCHKAILNIKQKHSLKIMIIDDDSFVMRSNQFIMNSCKQDLAKHLKIGNDEIEIVLFTDPVEALKYHAAERDVDIVISDMNMPSLNGFDVARAIKDTALVVLCSGAPLSPNESSCFDYILDKPLSKESFKKFLVEINLISPPVELTTSTLFKQPSFAKRKEEDVLIQQEENNSNTQCCNNNCALF